MRRFHQRVAWLACLSLFVAGQAIRLLAADSADVIFHHGKIAVVDGQFSVVEALAVKDGRVLRRRNQ